MLVPIGNNTFLDATKTSSSFWADIDENSFNKNSCETLTFTGNGLLNRDIFSELDLKYSKYTIKCITECTDWDDISIGYPLKLNQNKNGSRYLLIGFDLQEELSMCTKLCKKD